MEAHLKSLDYPELYIHMLACSCIGRLKSCILAVVIASCLVMFLVGATQLVPMHITHSGYSPPYHQSDHDPWD